MREDGFYWVLADGNWQPGEWVSSQPGWYLFGYDMIAHDDDVQEVGEAIVRGNAA